MTNEQRRSVLFWFVIIFGTIWAIIEFGIVIRFIVNDNINALNVIFSSTTAIGGAIALRHVFKLYNKEFLSEPHGIFDDVKECYNVRLTTIINHPATGAKELSRTNQSLIRCYLALLVKTLEKNVGKHNYEISVFCDPDEPYIASYYDTGGRHMPTSYSERLRNPFYYIEQKYEVVEILKNPSNDVHIVSDTHDASSGYSFKNQQQKEKIKSTALYCFMHDYPAAIVVSCDKAGGFNPNNENFKDLIKAIGSAVAVDLEIARRCFANNCVNSFH